MKNLTRVAFTALAFGLIPFSYSYAQESVDPALDESLEEITEPASEESIESLAEQDYVKDDKDESNDDAPTMKDAKAAINAMPGAKDATRGEISTNVEVGLYDIYGRQLAYREGAKKYRESLDKRRENFAKPRTKLIEQYQETRDIVYAAEAAEYQKNLKEEKDKKAPKKSAKKLPSGEAVDAVKEIDEAIELKEQEIPGSDAQVVKRKVVTADDAPEFDPARLNTGAPSVSSAPVPVEAGDENAEPPPMPEPVKVVKQPDEEEVPVVEENAETMETPVAEAAPQALLEEEPEDAVIEVMPQEPEEPLLPENAEESEEEAVNETAVEPEVIINETPVLEDLIGDKAVDEEDAIIEEEEFKNPFEDDEPVNPVPVYND